MLPVTKRSFWGLDDSIGYLARIIHRRFSAAVTRHAMPFGITVGQISTLQHLWVEDGIAQHKLGERLGVCDASVCTAVQRIEALGLLRREVNPLNRREMLIYLTAQGCDLVRRLTPVSIVMSEMVMRSISPDDALILQLLMQRVVQNLDAEEQRLAKLAEGRILNG